MIEGFTLRHKIDPAAGVPVVGSVSALYAASVAAVLAVVTHPAGDDANFGEAAQALLDGTSPAADPRGRPGSAPDAPSQQKLKSKPSETKKRRLI